MRPVLSWVEGPVLWFDKLTSRLLQGKPDLHLRVCAKRRSGVYFTALDSRRKPLMFLPDQFDSVVMDSLARGHETQPVAVYCDFLEVWDTEKVRLLKL